MKVVFYVQALVIALIALLYFYFGFHLNLFFTLWWWDVPVHILGGLWVSLAAVWILHECGIDAPVALTCVCAALIIGVGWEVFEYGIGLRDSTFMSYQLDTAKDLVDDMFGALLAVYIARKALRV